MHQICTSNFFASWQLVFGRYNAPSFQRYPWPKILSLVYIYIDFWNVPWEISLKVRISTTKALDKIWTGFILLNIIITIVCVRCCNFHLYTKNDYLHSFTMAFFICSIFTYLLTYSYCIIEFGLGPLKKFCPTEFDLKDLKSMLKICSESLKQNFFKKIIAITFCYYYKMETKKLH